MQLLGKQYFEQDESLDRKTEEPMLPTEDGTASIDGISDGDGLEQLCEAVTHHRVPAWMSAAAGIVRDNKRHLAVAASVLIIGFAVYLNWTMADGHADAVIDNTETLLHTDSAMTDQQDSLSNVGADAEVGDDYFAVSQINRQRARDEAIAVLQDVVDGATNLSDVQSDALAQISQIAADIEREAAIESLVKGKGFSDCVAVISGENINVIVRTASLMPNEIAQIQEIVYETAGILPANVKIIEK